MSLSGANILCIFRTSLEKITFFNNECKKWRNSFLAHQVSYCHHLASIVRRKLFQRSSPLKLLDQLEPNLVLIITKVSSFKIVSVDAGHQSIWLLLLKIKHMVKLQVLG